MPKSERIRAARVRAKATGQGLLKALETPQLEATRAQRDLEGAFLDKLDSLRYARQGAPFEHGVTRIEPSRESLTIHFGVAADLQRAAESVLPALEPCTNGWTEVHGVPGLRMRPHRAGTCFYRPGLGGEIILAGIRPDEIERYPYIEAAWPGHRAPEEWTSEERIFVKEYPELRAGLDIESAILRRIVLLTATEAFSIHSWRTINPNFTVDLVFDSLTREQAETLLHDITSPHLAPRLVLDSFNFPTAPLTDGWILLSMPTTGQTAEIRLTIRSWRRSEIQRGFPGQTTNTTGANSPRVITEGTPQLPPRPRQ